MTKRYPEATVYSARLPTPIYEQLRETAFGQHISINSAIVRAVEDWIAQERRERVGALDRVLGNMAVELAREAGDRAEQVAPAGR
jgi:hypothetical protein